MLAGHVFSIICRHNFKASHALTLKGIACEDMHSHDWRVECEVGASGLDDSCCVVDFRAVDSWLAEIVLPFEKSCINDVIDKKSPSAETVAQYIYNKLSNMPWPNQLKILSVTVWEDEDHGAKFSQ